MQSVALIGGFFIGRNIKLTTRYIADQIKYILDELRPDCCVCTLDNHGGILLTKIVRMVGIPYTLIVPPPSHFFSAPPPPMSNEWNKLSNSLQRDAYKIGEHHCGGVGNNREYYLSRNRWMINNTDASIILAPAHYKEAGMQDNVIKKAVDLANRQEKTHFVGLMRRRWDMPAPTTKEVKSTIEIKGWDNIGPGFEQLHLIKSEIRPEQFRQTFWFDNENDVPF